MKWRTKWVFAFMITIGVIGLAKLEKEGVIDRPVTQYVTSGEDFVAMKKWVASMMKDPADGKLTVSADQLQNAPLSEYESIL